jgi:hypothetical protein
MSRPVLLFIFLNCGCRAAEAVSDCHATGQLMPFVAVFLDCLYPRAKAFYQRYDFTELLGCPMKLALPWTLLDAMMM